MKIVKYKKGTNSKYKLFLEDGNIIDTLGEQKRENVTYDELP